MKNFRKKYQEMSKTKQHLISLITAVIILSGFGLFVHYSTIKTVTICDYTINYRVYVNDTIIDKTTSVRARTMDEDHFGSKIPTAVSYRGSNSINIGNESVGSTNKYIEFVNWTKENCETKEYSFLIN